MTGVDITSYTETTGAIEALENLDLAGLDSTQLRDWTRFLNPVNTNLILRDRRATTSPAPADHPTSETPSHQEPS